MTVLLYSFVILTGIGWGLVIVDIVTKKWELLLIALPLAILSSVMLYQQIA